MCVSLRPLEIGAFLFANIRNLAIMKVQITTEYKDLGLGRKVLPGEVLEVGELRAEVLVNKGFAIIVKAPEPAHVPKKETKHKPKKEK